MVSHRMFIVGIVTPRVIDLGVAVVAGSRNDMSPMPEISLLLFSTRDLGDLETGDLPSSLKFCARMSALALLCRPCHVPRRMRLCAYDEHVANIIEDHTANLISRDFPEIFQRFLDSVWCGHWQFSCWSLLVWSLITPTGSLRSQERDSSLDNGMAPTGGKIQWSVSNILENWRFYHTLGWLVQLGCLQSQHVTTCFRQTTRCRGFDLECWNTLKRRSGTKRNGGALQLLHPNCVV